MQSDDIPYSFVSLTSKIQHPSLEIDLKRITQKSASSKKSKKNKSAASSHSHLSLSARSDSNYNESETSSILRPISVEAITPPISKNWKNSSNSNTWEETPIKRVKATPSPMEKLSLPKKDKTDKYNNENVVERDKFIIEEEEEERESSEDAIDIDISEDADQKSLNFLDTLIHKMKNKSANNKSPSSDSLDLQPPLSPLTKEVKDTSSSKKKKKSTKSSPASSRYSSQAYLQEQAEDQKTNSLKSKCQQLDKYLEENGYNDIESGSDHRSKNSSKISNNSNKNSSKISNNSNKNSSKISNNSNKNSSKMSNNSNKNSSRSNRNINNNNDFEFLKKDRTRHKNYTVEKDNYQICDVKECDYEFESPYPLDMQHFLIFNVDNQPQSNNNDNTNYTNTPNPNSKISTPTQSRYVNASNDPITKDKNEDSCSIPFSNSSSGSQFSSPSRHGHSPNSPRLSPRLQKMKENSSSRGTSPDAKMLRDKAIGGTFLTMKDESIWCQLEEYNEEEENDDFDIENHPNRETRLQRQTAPLNTRNIRSRNDQQNTEIKSKTLNRNAEKFDAYVDSDSNSERRSRTSNERRKKSEIRERNLKNFSPSRLNKNSRRIESNKNVNQRNNLFPNKPDLDSSENGSFMQTNDRKPKKIIYAEHFVQTEDVSNEDELM